MGMLSQILLSHQYMPITTELLMTTLEQILPKLNREMDTKPQEATLSTSPMDVSRLLTTKTMEMELSRMFLTLEPHHMDQPLESQLLLRLLPLAQLLLPMAQLLSVKPNY